MQQHVNKKDVIVYLQNILDNYMRITQRLQFIKLTCILGLFISMILSLNLWASQRWFPKVPLFENFCGIPAPYDYINLAILIILLVCAFWYESKIPALILVLFNIYLCIDDQNRLQPWFYNYTLILFILLFYKKRVDEPNNYISVFISLQLLVALVYIFSGIQKINPLFLKDTFTWIINPLGHILTEKQVNLINKLGITVPYIEISIGLGLLIKPLRFIAVPLVITMHVFILAMIGPFGNSYNYVVWPWNIIMIILNLLLFSNINQERFFDISILFKHIPFYIVITLMLIFPIFSFNNKYDSYLSSSLYSGNTHDCKLILSDSAYNKLPYYVRNFVSKNDDYNILYVKKWALTELGTPCIPEYRVFKYVYNYVIDITKSSAKQVKMEFTEREKLFNF